MKTLSYTERNKAPTHTHPKGARVKIYNGTEIVKGKPQLRLEGVATIVKLLGTDNYYQVRFDGETETYARFVNDDAAFPEPALVAMP